MGELLSEVGKKLAERWLTALLLPGLLIIAAAICGSVLGHRDALNFTLLAIELQRLGNDLQPQPAATILAIAGAFLCSTATGFAAQALGVGVQRALVGTRPRWLVRFGHTHTEPEPPIKHAPPGTVRSPRLTSIGDRFRLMGERVNTQYGLIVTLAWPRLWLLLSDQARTPLVISHTSYRTAITMTAWGLLYIILGAIWWPAALAGMITAFVGYRRAMTTAAVFADLIESVVDIYQHALADAVGIALPSGRLTWVEGAEINKILNKQSQAT